MDIKKIGNVLRKTCIESRKISLLKDEIRKQFEEEVIELADNGLPNL